MLIKYLNNINFMNNLKNYYYYSKIYFPYLGNYNVYFLNLSL